MSPEYCIVYGYHIGGKATEEVVRKLHANLCRDNPLDVVVPVTCGYPVCIDGTVDVRHRFSHGLDPYGPPGTDEHRNAVLWAHNDLMLWRYLLHPDAVIAKRYVYFDWDVFSHGMSVRDFYASTDGADVVAINPITPMNRPSWCWWGHWPSVLPPGTCWGMLPFCGATFSRRAAMALASFDPELIAPEFSRAQNEFRVGVMARWHGYPITGLHCRETMLHTYGGPCRLQNVPGIYHPVPYIPEF